MIKIIHYTEHPLTTIGQVAGICYNSTNEKAFPRIAKSCIEGGHTRTCEFADIIIEIDEYSAKVLRELYTHIAGTSRLQSSTRYIDYSEQFSEVTPKSVSSNLEALKLWDKLSKDTFTTIAKMKELGIPREDCSNKLPLSYVSKMVLKINVRALIHMFEVRTCTRAYHEFRDLMKELKEELIKLNDIEWKYLCDEVFKVKCDKLGYCSEGDKFTCGYKSVK